MQEVLVDGGQFVQQNRVEELVDLLVELHEHLPRLQGAG
jgi:hypothetical protein